VFEKENKSRWWLTKVTVFPGQSPHFLTPLLNNNKLKERKKWCDVAIPFLKQERNKDKYTVLCKENIND